MPQRNRSSLAPRRRRAAAAGFGLVELLVSISIIVLVTSIVLIRHNSFNSAVLLRSQAYEVALRAREVQQFAVSAIGESANFRNRFGLHFDTSVIGNPQYQVFRDSNDDSYYDSGEDFGTQGFLDERFTIDALRVVGGPADGSTPTSVSVVFERPNFDANFYEDPNDNLNASRLEIDVRLKESTGNGVDAVRTIEIGRTGQISVR